MWNDIIEKEKNLLIVTYKFRISQWRIFFILGSTHVSSSDPIKLESQINSNGNTQHQLDMKLDENAKLLIQLRQAQYDRLCQPSNKIHQIIPSSSHQQHPSESLNEYDLAEKVLYNLSDMTHMSSNGPEQVISSEAIHHNLGIMIHNESLTVDTL